MLLYSVSTIDYSEWESPEHIGEWAVRDSIQSAQAWLDSRGFNADGDRIRGGGYPLAVALRAGFAHLRRGRWSDVRSQIERSLAQGGAQEGIAGQMGYAFADHLWYTLGADGLDGVELSTQMINVTGGMFADGVLLIRRGGEYLGTTSHTVEGAAYVIRFMSRIHWADKVATSRQGLGLYSSCGLVPSYIQNGDWVVGEEIAVTDGRWNFGSIWTEQNDQGGKHVLRWYRSMDTAYEGSLFRFMHYGYMLRWPWDGGPSGPLVPFRYKSPELICRRSY